MTRNTNLGFVIQIGICGLGKYVAKVGGTDHEGEFLVRELNSGSITPVYFL